MTRSKQQSSRGYENGTKLFLSFHGQPLEFNKTLSLSLLLSVYVRKRARTRDKTFLFFGSARSRSNGGLNRCRAKFSRFGNFFFFFNKREKKLQFRDLLLFVEKSIVKRCLQIYNCYLIIIEILENIRNVTQVLLYCNYFACA